MNVSLFVVLSVTYIYKLVKLAYLYVSSNVGELTIRMKIQQNKKENLRAHSASYH